jgi:hypothetical protein
MKNAKKILILLLTLTLAFGLFACGGDGGQRPVGNLYFLKYDRNSISKK